jgi:hypothetical protein
MHKFGNFEILPMAWRRRLCGVEGVDALLPLDPPATSAAREHAPGLRRVAQE